MKFITTTDLTEGTRALAEKIISFLAAGKRVLWLIPGGSNIPIAVRAMDIIRSTVVPDVLKDLSIALTDERYGPVGHADSNWQQLQDAHMDLTGIKAYPILDGSTLAETVRRYGETIGEILKTTDAIVGQFGMGADGHIAGIQPHTPAVTERLPASGYQGTPFIRVTLTFPVLRKITIAYMFVSMTAKKAAIERLHDATVSLDDQPAQILKELPEANIYID